MKTEVEMYRFRVETIVGGKILYHGNATFNPEDLRDPKKKKKIIKLIEEIKKLPPISEEEEKRIKQEREYLD